MMKKLIAIILCTAVWANQAISEDEPNFFDQFIDRDLTDEELAEEFAKLTGPLSLFGGEGAKYAYTQSGSFFVVVYAKSPLDSYGPLLEKYPTPLFLKVQLLDLVVLSE